MNQQDLNDTTAPLEDLDAQNDSELKGGPKKIFIGGLSVTGSAESLSDLEPSGDVAGGLVASARDANLFSFQNHNETVSEDSEAEAAPEQLEDLAVSDEQSAQIAGGLPAVQACREAAGNHNETVSEDSETQAEEAVTEKLADLSVDESTEAEIKGGPFITSVQYPYK